MYSSAKVQFPDLVENPQFKSVKNMIVKTVAAMQCIPPPDLSLLVVENEDASVEIPPDSFDFVEEDTIEARDTHQSKALTEAAYGLFVNMARVIEEDYDRSRRVVQSKTDSKLRRMIRKKKMELGIKEEPTPSQKL